MIIQHVETWTDKLPLTRPYVIATREVSTVDLHFVRLESHLGVSGYGCAAPTMVTSESPEECFQAMDSLAHDVLMRQNVQMIRPVTLELQRQCLNFPSALAALDMAVYDLLARSIGVSVASLIGHPMKPLPTSITIGILPLEQTLEEAQEYISRGFRCLKVKLGLNYEEDLARLHALRSICPENVTIRVDANQGYTLEQTTDLLHALHALNLELVEQPLVREEDHQMIVLPHEARQRMAADESLICPSDALRLSNGMPFGIWNIKLMKCGGITGALTIADIAEMTGIELMWGCMDESVISIAAALHTAYACSQTRYIDLDGSFDLSRDTAHGGFILSDGYLHILDEPGLGVTQ